MKDDGEPLEDQATQSFRHQFLVAMPGLADGYFSGTVTYLCEHNAEGAMGLVINRASEMTLLELLSQLDLPTPARFAERAVLEGGPVARERGFVLHSADRRYDASLDLGPGLVLSASRQALEAIATDAGPEKFLIALGFAGWGPGQLEQTPAHAQSAAVCVAHLDERCGLPRLPVANAEAAKPQIARRRVLPPLLKTREHRLPLDGVDGQLRALRRTLERCRDINPQSAQQRLIRDWARRSGVNGVVRRIGHRRRHDGHAALS